MFVKIKDKKAKISLCTFKSMAMHGEQVFLGSLDATEWLLQ